MATNARIHDKNGSGRPVLEVPRLVARHFEHGNQARHITLLMRSRGHRWLAERDVRIYPRALPALLRSGVRSDWPVSGVTVILSGTGRLHLGPQSRALAAGDVVVFDGVRTDALRYDEGPEFAEASVSFDEVTAQGLRDLALWPDAGRARRVDPRGARLHFEALHQAMEMRNLSHAEVLRRAIRLLGWVEQRDAAGDDGGGEIERLVIRASAWLRAHYRPTDRIETLAGELGCSTGHLRRRFKAAVGMTLAEYQLRERMTRATALLCTRDVTGTAEALGYSDPFVFSRQFKSQCGLSPRDFRATARSVAGTA